MADPLNITDYTRWIALSVYKHIDARRQDVPLYIEGQQRDTQTKFRYFELRIDGPNVSLAGTKDEYKFDIELNINCVTSTDEINLMHIEQLAGIALMAVIQDICVYRLGPNVQDDKSFLGVLQTVSEQDTMTHNIGVLEPNSNTIQKIVSAPFCMHI